MDLLTHPNINGDNMWYINTIDLCSINKHVVYISLHKYIIDFVTCVYKVDKTRKISKIKTYLKYLYYLLRYVVF